MLDSHCHIKRGVDSLPGTFSEGNGLPAPRSSGGPSGPWSGGVFFGTHPAVDWDMIEQLAACSSGKVRGYGFGIHPWFVPQGESDQREREGEDLTPSCTCVAELAAQGDAHRSWTSTALLAALEQKLIDHPSAWVGEIGLDKLRPTDRSRQDDMFMQQLLLAAKYRRGVSVHCVRSFGPLLTMLTKVPKDQFPPAVVLHGFTGSPEFVTSLLKLPKAKSERIFFGVGECTSFRLRDFEQLLQSIPPERVLVESDQHWDIIAANATTVQPRPQMLSLQHSSFVNLLPPCSLQENAEKLLATLQHES